MVVPKISTDLKQRLFSGIGWSLCQIIFARMSSLLAFIIVAHLISQEAYGSIGLIQSTIGIFSLVAGGGLGITATKYISENKSRNVEKIGEVLGFSSIFTVISGLAMSLALFYFSDFIAEHQFDNITISPLLKIGSLILFFEAVNGYQLGALVGFEEYKYKTLAGIWGGIFHFLFIVIGTYYGGINGCLFGYASSRFIYWAINHYYISKVCKEKGVVIKYSNWYKEFYIFLQLGLPTLLNSIIVLLSVWFANTILVRSDSGLIQMSLFNVANQLKEIVMFIPATVATVVLPLLSSSLASNKTSEFKNILSYNLLLNFLISFIIALPFILFPKLILSIWGKEYVAGSLCLVLLIISTVFVSLNNVFAQLIVSKDKMWYGFVFNSVWAIVFLTTVKIGISYNIGAVALSLGYFISYFVHLLIQGGFSFYYLKYENNKR